MGKCSCGVKQEIINPSEKKEKYIPPHHHQTGSGKVIIQKSNNFLLYLMLAGIVSIIAIMLTREC
jgi:hypothetical protein